MEHKSPHGFTVTCTTRHYALNGSRVVCNPRGYPGEQVTDRFDPTLCVAI